MPRRFSSSRCTVLVYFRPYLSQQCLPALTSDFFFVLLQVIRLELEPELFGSPAVNAPTAATAPSPTYVSLYCVFFLLIFTQLLQIVQFLSFRVRRWSTPFTLPDTECKKKRISYYNDVRKIF